MTTPRCLTSFAGVDAPRFQELPRTTKARSDPPELDEPLTVLKGVGPATAREARRLGLKTLGDLLLHFPRRHEDYTSSSRRIGELKVGEEATVTGTIERVTLQRTRRRNLRIVKAMLRDETGYIEAVWFNQDYLADQLAAGDELLLRGRYEGKGGMFRVIGHEVLGKGVAGLHTLGLVPVYPTTGKISVRRLRGWLGEVRWLSKWLSDPLPSRLLHELKLPWRSDAVLAMHFPGSRAEFALARRRLIFEELFLMQVALLSHRARFGRERRGASLGEPGDLTRGFIEGLPFRFTADQKRVCAEISADLQSISPMQRLLQGDVGSGKTVVAVYTILRAVESGRQAALMAPTEVLAEQHYFNLERMLAGLGVRTVFLSSRLKAGERRELLDEVAAGRADLAVGTHALIQEEVSFPRLAVIVVDEQHRFGVGQREELVDKATLGGVTPHVLHMTATPIPRTLALTLYGDLDVSTIRKMPPGRRRVRTWLVPEGKRAGAYGFIRGQLDAGRQCYVVCPMIEESDTFDVRAVSAEADRLRAGEFSGYRVGVMHGRMPPAEKQETMRRFAAGDIQVLVATTVIEVGVDVPNATVMMIEEADRFGLAQLHQLRGRVGRGRHDSCCLLFADPGTDTGRRRLEAMVSTADGFELADLDLEIRGEGQLFGVRQSGLPDLKLARLTRDQELLRLARERARELIGSGRGLEAPENALLRDEIERMFGGIVEWLDKL